MATQLCIVKFSFATQCFVGANYQKIIKYSTRTQLLKQKCVAMKEKVIYLHSNNVVNSKKNIMKKKYKAKVVSWRITYLISAKIKVGAPDKPVAW